MYSVVLMLAVSGGAEMPDRCRGCRGCCGCYASCSCSGWYGCHGCWGCQGMQVHHFGCCGCQGARPQPAPKMTGSLPATLIVSLPVDATLTIDDHPTTSSSASRIFTTPPLQTGSEYSYTLRAQIMREGRPVAVSRQVAVRPGEQTQIRLDFPVSETSVTER